MMKEQRELHEIRSFVKKVYDLGDCRQKVDIDSFSDDEVRRLAENEGGLPIATPAFDGARESEIKDLLNGGYQEAVKLHFMMAVLAISLNVK